MDRRHEVRQFLTSRRARLSPEAAGVAVRGNERRVPGPRREEVAVLAGVSVDYYVRLERGNLGGASASVLEALARALQLNHAERLHLYDLAHGGTREGASHAEPIRPSLQRLLDAIAAPAFVRNRRLDYLAANRLGRALLCDLFDTTGGHPNQGRYVFLDPCAKRFHPDCGSPSTRRLGVARRRSGGRSASRSPPARAGRRRFPTSSHLTFWAATAEPGSPSEAALSRLGQRASPAGFAAP